MMQHRERKTGEGHILTKSFVVIEIKDADRNREQIFHKDFTLAKVKSTKANKCHCFFGITLIFATLYCSGEWLFVDKLSTGCKEHM